MVSINSSIGSLNNLNTQQPLTRQRLASSNTSVKENKEEFSALIDSRQKQSALSHNVEKQSMELSNYSPLMMRYGVNKINEIQSIAKSYGINDITNQDFDYAIRYGRSLLADYLV